MHLAPYVHPQAAVGTWVHGMFWLCCDGRSIAAATGRDKYMTHARTMDTEAQGSLAHIHTNACIPPLLI